MGSTTKPSVDRVYEDFEPFYEWNRDERLVNVMLPGFRTDQLKVQVTPKPTLRLMGERQITENRWRRFNLELPLLSDYDTDQVTAKFVGAKLSIKFGKLTRPNETTSAPQNAEEKKATQEDGPKAEAKTNGEVSGPKAPQQEEIKNETTENKDKKAQEAKTNNGSRETKENEASKAPKTGQEEQKAENREDSQKMPQKEERKEETESKSKSVEADQERVHGTTQRAVEEQKETGQEFERKLSEKKKGKAEETEDHGNEMMMGSGGPDDGLSKRSVAKMKERLEMISGLVEEVKKQNKMAHVVVLIFLVFLIGIYIKNVVKSCFAIGGSKNQEL